MSETLESALGVVLANSLKVAKPTGTVKSEKEYEEELKKARPIIEAARGLAGITDRAGSALKTMDEEYNAAAKSGGGKDYETASTSLQKAVDQANAATASVREYVTGRQDRAVQQLGDIPARIGKLVGAPQAVPQALQATTNARDAAKQLIDKDPADWRAANGAVTTFDSEIGKLRDTCTDEAGKVAVGFAQRFKTQDDKKPAGKDIVKKYTDYATARKALEGKISSGDGLGALEASAAAEQALAAFEAAASPSDVVKQQKALAAYNKLSKIKDSDLKKMSTLEKAELALDVCANGTPKGQDELKQLSRLYNKSPPDKQFLKKREEHRKAIVAEVIKMPELQNLYDKKGNFDKKAWETFIKDPDKVNDLLGKIGKAQTDTLGMPAKKINRKPDPPEGTDDKGNLTFGGYNPKTDEIDLNLHPECLIPIEEAIGTIIHETFHAHQDVMVKKLKAGEIGPDDPDYPTAMMYMVNDIPIGYLFASKVGHKAYASQPTEIDAEDQGSMAAKTILKELKKAAKSKRGK